MEYLVAWYRLIFFLPLAVGMLLVVGVVTGVAEFHHELDLDGDGVPDDLHVGHGHEGHDQEGNSGMLAFLGFGRVPVALILMVLLLLFGGIGTIANFFLEPFLKVSSVFVLFSFGAATVGSFLLTGSVARLIRKYMPTLETKTVTKHDIVGASGTLLFATEKNSSMANVRKDGDLFQVKIRTVEDLPKGQQVLITDYDDTSDVYDAVRDPINEG